MKPEKDVKKTKKVSPRRKKKQSDDSPVVEAVEDQSNSLDEPTNSSMELLPNPPQNSPTWTLDDGSESHSSLSTGSNSPSENIVPVQILDSRLDESGSLVVSPMQGVTVQISVEEVPVRQSNSATNSADEEEPASLTQLSDVKNAESKDLRIHCSFCGDKLKKAPDEEILAPTLCDKCSKAFRTETFQKYAEEVM